MKFASWILLSLLVVAGCDSSPKTEAGTQSSGTSSAPDTKTEPNATNETTETTTKEDPADKKSGGGKPSTSELADSVPLAGEEVGVIDTKQGQIVFRFFEDVAPGHVKNFKDLANKGFYNGTTFHRIIPLFMIQGGDPNTKGKDVSTYGQGGPGYQIKAEFSTIPHVRGILSMARGGDPNSAGSQFFIVHQESPHLNGQYSVFGQVVKTGKEAAGQEAAGLAVVDKIASTPSEQGTGTAHERVEMKVRIAKWPLK